MRAHHGHGRRAQAPSMRPVGRPKRAPPTAAAPAPPSAARPASDATAGDHDPRGGRRSRRPRTASERDQRRRPRRRRPRIRRPGAGRARVSWVRPSSSAMCTASTSPCDSSTATSWARSWRQALVDVDAGQLAQLALGRLGQLPALLGDVGLLGVALRAHRGVLADGHREGAGDQRRRPRPATTAWRDAPAAATAMTRQATDTMPSLAPSTAARSHPPRWLK